MNLPRAPYVRVPGPPAPRPRRPRRRLRAVLVAGMIVGNLSWLASWLLPEPPAPVEVKIDRRPLTQYGADRAAGAMLVAWHDPDHLQFVTWDVNRMTGCVPLAVRYWGPDGRTDPRSIPSDVKPDVIGKARWKGMRLKVWFGCKEAS